MTMDSRSATIPSLTLPGGTDRRLALSTRRQRRVEMPPLPNFQHVDKISKNSSAKFHEFQVEWSSMRLKDNYQQLRGLGFRWGAQKRGCPPLPGGRQGLVKKRRQASLRGHGCPRGTETLRPPPHARAWACTVMKRTFPRVGSKVIRSKGTAANIQWKEENNDEIKKKNKKPHKD